MTISPPKILLAKPNLFSPVSSQSVRQIVDHLWVQNWTESSEGGMNRAFLLYIGLILEIYHKNVVLMAHFGHPSYE